VTETTNDLIKRMESTHHKIAALQKEFIDHDEDNVLMLYQLQKEINKLRQEIKDAANEEQTE
jgi:hypothetical protein